MGYDKIIWTLYRYAGDSRTVVDRAKVMSLYAITMPIDRAKSGLGLELKKMLGISSYVHTINSLSELMKFRRLGIDEIYTDWLTDPLCI